MASVRPKKHLGQHFLTDENVAKRIAGALLEKNGGLPVVEIGPGTGVLTKYLLPEIREFVALEIDTESVSYLTKTYPGYADRFLLADFLEYDPGILFPGKYNVIGNFPYNISSQIMFRVLEFRDRIPTVTGMFQKEVAERIAEPPGSKTYGILSVLLQAYYDIEYLFTVDENVFRPPPKVKSGVIRLIRNSVEKLPCDERLFKNVVKTAFNQRRKIIRNSIKPLCNFSLPDNPMLMKRPEQLGVAEFVALTELVAGSRSQHQAGLL